MVKNKDPDEIRESVIKKYYGALKGMNFGSEKNIDKVDEIVMGSGYQDVIMTVEPDQIQSTSENDSNDLYFTNTPLIQMSTYGPERKLITIEVDS